TTLVVGRLRAGKQPTIRAPDPVEAAVVADIDLAVRPHRRTVGTAAQPGNHMLLAVRHDSGERLARDLDQDHRSVWHGDRPLRELETGGDFLVRRHRRSSLTCLSYLPLKVGLR